MSVWHDNPEWFDEWIMDRATEGKLGLEIQARVERGDADAAELWNLDTTRELGSAALLAYCERMIP